MVKIKERKQTRRRRLMMVLIQLIMTRDKNKMVKMIPDLHLKSVNRI
jgi:hypothetical protein